MWNTKQKINYLLYKLFAAWLPISQRSAFAKKTRYFFSKRICSLGKNVNIEKNAYFTPLLTVGDNSGVGINCEIYGSVSIGKNVMMGPEVIIYTQNHNFSRTDIPMIEQGNSPAEPVKVGDDCWIGRRVIIMPGVTIGDGCVIGAGAVVTRDLPPYSVSAGVPAKVIKYRKHDISK